LERGREVREYQPPPSQLITGIAGCCARAESGHTAATPPRSVMNSRRAQSFDHLVGERE
jgi:hypothetical protein